LRTPTKNQLFNAKNPKSLRASPAEFLRQPAGQPASQSGPLSALLSKENALKILVFFLHYGMSGKMDGIFFSLHINRSFG